MFTKNSTGFNLAILFLMLVATSVTVYQVQKTQIATEQAASINTCNKIPGQYCSAQICTNMGNVAGLGRCPATLAYCCKIAPTPVVTSAILPSCPAAAACYTSTSQECSVGYSGCQNSAGQQMCCAGTTNPR